MGKNLLRSITAGFLLLTILSLNLVAFAYISDGAAAVNVVGAVNTNSPYNAIYDSGTANNGEGSTNARGLSSPQDIEVDTTNNRLFVADKGNNRVLVYNLSAANVLTNYTADFVLGQANFTSSSSGTSSSTLSSPVGLYYNSSLNYLFVSDYGNNRVLAYDVASIIDGEVAVNVLGQSGFGTGAAATTQVGLSGPRGLAFKSSTNRLFVADSVNKRILSYNLDNGITDGEAAENVLGQADFLSAVDATSPASQSGLTNPSGIDIDSTNNRLFIADYNNHRVLIHSISSITNNQNASYILGQSSWTSATSATSTTGLSYPYGVAHDSGDNRLFVASAGNHRTTVYNFADGISNNEAAVNVLGQSDFTSSSFGTTNSTLKGPYDASYENGNDYIYVTDNGNHRVMVFDAAVDPGGASSPEFSTITFIATLLIGIYILHRKKLFNPVASHRM